MSAIFKPWSMCVLSLLLAVSALPARELSMDERVAAQEAIEQVYWNHRTWPKENPGPKPPLSSVMSNEAIRGRVEDYLKKSNALETWWQRPVTADQLQAELDRMAKNTRDGAMLRELFAALENDSFVIAETLARQTLVERLIRNWYVNDTRFHGDQKRKAVASVATCTRTDCMKSMSGAYRETTSKQDDASSDDLAALATTLGATAESLPTGRLSRVEETPEAFLVTAIIARRDNAITVATVAWPKLSFENWWAVVRGGVGSAVETASAAYTLPEAPLTSCTSDTWGSTKVEVPDPRQGHVAVWTGTEMIVWGGSSNAVAPGGRYNPSTDTWTLTSTTNAPAARGGATAVWTGTEMIVWGGAYSSQLNTGGRYNPTSDSWVATSTGSNVPAARINHTAVWTGTLMIVWGGHDGAAELSTGGRYDPSTDGWTPTSTGGDAPSARDRHTAVWTGTEMIVWAGAPIASTHQGGRYDPSTDTWIRIGEGSFGPSAREFPTSVWTGTEVIIWGGVDGHAFVNSGGRYNPSTNHWTETSTGANAPTGREHHTAVWTGSEMIVWGGHDDGIALNTGGRYSPSTNSWTATSTGTGVPTARQGHAALWTGTEMIVWGGDGRTSSGGRYRPSTDSWTPTSTGTTVPSARFRHSSVWTGAEMIVWGGMSSTALASGGRYVPSTDSWAPTSMGANSPVARDYHSAVWTGTEMIVWGGGGFPYLNTGGRYSPTADSWAATSTGTNVPQARQGQSAVWTGTEMIIWGGLLSSGSATNTGGRYNASSDSWTPTSIGTNLPAARSLHTAVWTGTQMVVWGGSDGSSSLNTGGRYSVSTDSWGSISTGANVPVARANHTAVWTGAQMIVWGGGSPYLNTGGRYDPSNDSWTTTATGTGPPSARTLHTALWTGTEMIVWGGTTGASSNSGGRYNPASDSWTPTSTGVNVPSGRDSHSAVWTGTEMIVWGGYPHTSTGGRYCAAGCASPAVWYQDQDGDGYGIAPVTVPSCTQPQGYASIPGDCNDASSQTHPGALEFNDGIDNQCPGGSGYGVIDEISGVSGFFTPSNKTVFSWPAQTGATSYEVARSPFPDFHAGCVHATLTSPSWSDPANPAAGVGFHYLVRAAAPHVGSWGQRRPAAERTVCAACLNTGDWCDDGSVCTVGDSCIGTTCVPGPSLSCDDGNPCTNDSCNPVTGCVYTNNALACNDGNACTSGDVCQGGACTGTLPPGAGHLVISQIQVDGDGASSTEDEFVEIYNPTSSAVTLSGRSLQYKTNAGGQVYFKHSFGATASVPSHGWFLVARAGYNGSPAADEINSAFPMGTTVGSVFLVSDDVLLSGACSTSGTILDKVGYGTGNCPEGSPVAFPSANNSILRKPGGACGNGTDTDSNPADFLSRTPSTPRSSSSTPQP